jgi:hypothetical protein
MQSSNSETDPLQPPNETATIRFSFKYVSSTIPCMPLNRNTAVKRASSIAPAWLPALSSGL